MRLSSLQPGRHTSSPHRRTGHGIWWAVLLLVSLGLVVVSGTDPARSVQELGARAMAPVHAAVSSIGRGIADVVGTIGAIGQLRAENDELRSTLAAAEQRIAELQEAARENARLRALLGLRAVLGWDLLPARVVAVGTGALTWEVAIDAGRDDGVAVGMPVIGAAPGGGALAGMVVEARSDRAIVLLTVDPRSRVVARDQETDALGVVQGQPGGQLVMTQVAVTDEAAVGDTIVTAGLEIEGVAASPYPAGLLIGTVSALETDANGLTRTVFVRPALDPRAVEWLMVVRSATID